MSARLKIDGLEDLRRGLQALPSELQSDAEAAVRSAADATAEHVRRVYESARSSTSTYTIKGGIKKSRKHLADSVVVTTRGAKTGAAAARVKVTAPHAHWFEFGTQERAWAGGKSTGAMPARATLVPKATAERREMVSELIDVVRRAGLEVRGA